MGKGSGAHNNQAIAYGITVTIKKTRYKAERRAAISGLQPAIDNGSQVLAHLCTRWQVSTAVRLLAISRQYQPRRATGTERGLQVAQRIAHGRYPAQAYVIAPGDVPEQAVAWLATLASIVRAVRTNKDRVYMAANVT